MRWGGGTWAFGGDGPAGSREEGWRLGGAHERAADDDSFAVRRDVRELLFDVALVDGAVALQNALALRGSPLSCVKLSLLTI